MAVLNTADRIYLNGQEVDRVYLNDVIVYNRIDLYQLFKDRVLADGGTFIENPIVFNSEKLLLTPNGYKEDVIYAALPIDGSGDFTFSRNSSATYIEDGIIKTALPNVPRIQDGKILIEGQATNLYVNSHIFTLTDSANLKVTGDVPNDYAPWTSTLCETLTDNQNTELSSFRIRSSFIPSQAGFNTYSISFIVEDTGDSGVVSLILTIIGITFFFDFDTKEVSNTVGIDRHKVTEVKEGVYLIDIISESLEPSSGSSYEVRGGNVQLLGSALSKIGSFRISYAAYDVNLDDFIGIIPTSGTAATRLADIATVTPPAGVTEIIETIDGVEQPPITTIPPTYQLPDGNIDNVKMI